MSDAYDRLQRDHEKPPKRVVDHSEAWSKLQPVAAVNGTIGSRIEDFCRSKNITMAGLAALDTRVDTDKNGAVLLAWAYPAYSAGKRFIPAVKLRDIANGNRRNLEPSAFLQPRIIGNLD